MVDDLRSPFAARAEVKQRRDCFKRDFDARPLIVQQEYRFQYFTKIDILRI